MTNGAASNLDLNDLEVNALDFAELSDMYRFFRINHLECKAWWTGIVSGTASEPFAIYFQQNGATNTVALSNLEGIFAVGIAGGEGSQPVPADLKLGRAELTTIVPWFVTLNDTAAGADADGPGNLQFITRSGTTADGYLLYDIHMSVTFRSPLDPTSISANIAKRVKDGVYCSQVEKTDSNLKPEMVQAPRTKVPGVVRRR